VVDGHDREVSRDAKADRFLSLVDEPLAISSADAAILTTE
jgi:hypothetical protein